MNLSMTPLTDAWNVANVKHISYNKYAEPELQKKILKTSGQSISKSTPHGYEKSISSMPLSTANKGPNPPEQVEVPMLETPNEEQTEPKKSGSVIIEITDDKVLEKLAPYKDSFTKGLVEELLRNHFMNMQYVKEEKDKNDTVETFIGNVNVPDDISTYLMIGILIYVIDIIMRNKF
jgi:hypothetical protein